MALKKTGEALADEIVRLAKDGTIPVPFRVADFKPHVRNFSPTHIRTVLSNYEKNDGDQVKRGREPRFVRVAYGLYEPI